MADSLAREITCRSLLVRVGQGLAAAEVAGTFIHETAAQQHVPDPPGRRLGRAIVGLGILAINEFLPAFAKCEKSKVVALVSGHPEKANKLALRYGVSQEYVYDDQNYDSIKGSQEVDHLHRSAERLARGEHRPRAASRKACPHRIP
jgi:hypothetical protein